MVYEDCVCELVQFHKVQIRDLLYFQIFIYFIISERFFAIWYKCWHYEYDPCMEKYFHS